MNRLNVVQHTSADYLGLIGEARLGSGSAGPTEA